MESYPPLFRNNIPNPNPNPNPNPHPVLDVPWIDFTHLDPAQLGEACRSFGLFRLINHGIPPTLSSQLHSEAKKLFSLPFESKNADGFLNPSTYFWGTPALSLSVKGVHWLEGIHVPIGKAESREGEIQDLGCCSPFRSLVNLYGQHMVHITRVIFNALAKDLHSSVDMDGFLRVYRYPRCPDTSNYLGMAAHTDSSVLSILNQDDVGGLQVLHNNLWFNVAPVADTLVVNLGDMIQV